MRREPPLATAAALSEPHASASVYALLSQGLVAHVTFAFARLSKGAGKQRCRKCVEAAEAAAAGAGAAKQAAAIEEARRALQQAEIGGAAAVTAAAASRLAALEAEKVTGLKPVVLGRGGRGRGRGGGGSWRARGAGGK